jgi:hypothetical protein
MRRRRGSTLVESALVLMLFIVILLGIMDFGQILFFHHVLTERARAGARYAVVHVWDVAAVQKYVARNDPAAADGTPGLFGVTPAMVQVLHSDVGTPSERVEVRISSYQMRFLSPWLAGTFTPGPFRAVMPIESGGASN